QKIFSFWVRKNCPAPQGRQGRSVGGGLTAQQILFGHHPALGLGDVHVTEHALVAVLVDQADVPAAGSHVVEGQRIALFEDLAAEVVFTPIVLAGGREVDFVQVPAGLVDDLDGRGRQSGSAEAGGKHAGKGQGLFHWRLSSFVAQSCQQSAETLSPAYYSNG